MARGIFLVFMTLMVAGYIMGTRENIIGFFRSLLPMRSRIGYDRLLWRIDRGLSGVVRGQLLICAVNGVLSAIGYWMFDLKYWPILAILSAATFTWSRTRIFIAPPGLEPEGSPGGPPPPAGPGPGSAGRSA